MRRIFAMTALTGLLVLATATAGLAQQSGGKVTVIHGVPGLTVDVYVNGDLTISGFEFTNTAGPLDLPAGDYDLAITAAGDSIDNAVLTGTATVADGLNASIVAHLLEDGSPTISIFGNDTSSIAAGNGRLTVRHTAAAPTVDILLADGTELFTGLSNPNEAKADVPAGSYDVLISPAGAGVDGSVFSAPGTAVPEGTNRIVYAVGSLADGNFTLVVQDISGLSSAPAAVPSGSGDLAPGFPFAALVVLIGAVAVVMAVAPRALRKSE